MTDTEDSALTVLFEDEHLVAVNKPAGLLVHPSAIDSHNTDTLISRITHQLGTRCAPIHRLDRATSGVILLARHSGAARHMGQTWHETTEKTYLAVVRGHLKDAVDLEHPVRDRDSGKRQLAQTRFRPLAEVEIPEAVDRYPTTRYGLVEAKPITGRRHQIRQHLKHLSHPIVGDSSFGKSVHNRYIARRFDAARLLLHAKGLSFTHPVTHLRVSLEAAPDAAFQRVLTGLPWRTAQDTPE